MPKSLEKAVSAMLDSKDFYPDKSPEDRKSTAYAIATKQLKAKKKQFIDLGAETRKKLLQMPDFEPGLQMANITFENGKLFGQKIHYSTSLELGGEIDFAALGAIIEIQVTD
jgi:hypothetical protein